MLNHCHDLVMNYMRINKLELNPDKAEQVLPRTRNWVCKQYWRVCIPTKGISIQLQHCNYRSKQPQITFCQFWLACLLQPFLDKNNLAIVIQPSSWINAMHCTCGCWFGRCNQHRILTGQSRQNHITGTSILKELHCFYLFPNSIKNACVYL